MKCDIMVGKIFCAVFDVLCFFSLDMRQTLQVCGEGERKTYSENR